MEKIDELIFDIDNIINNYRQTKYDYLFESRIVSRGINYYYDNKVKILDASSNIISSVVEGNEKYNVLIELLNDNEIKVKCECPYHKETNIYCKHIYATIYKYEMNIKNEEIFKLIKINCSKGEEVLALLKQLYNDNEEWFSYLKERVKTYIKQEEDYFNELKKVTLDDKEIISVCCSSCTEVNNLIKNYNNIVDSIKKEKSEEKEETKEIKESPIISNNNQNEIIKKPKKVKNNDIPKKNVNKKNRLKRKQKEPNLISFIFIIFSLIFTFIDALLEGFGYKKVFKTSYKKKKYGFFDLFDDQKEMVNKGIYDSTSFEEEELEDDDYYNEDID